MKMFKTVEAVYIYIYIERFRKIKETKVINEEAMYFRKI